MARALKGHYGLVFALGFACWVHSFRGELAEAEALVDEWFEMSSEYGLPFWITWSSCLKGLIQSKRGDYEAGLARMQKSVIGYRATGAQIGLVHFMTELAETALAAGDYGLGLATIEEARAICAKTGNRYHAADTHRVQGELLIGANRAEEGELRLLHSLNVARSQGARSLELRTLISSGEAVARLADTAQGDAGWVHRGPRYPRPAPRRRGAGEGLTHRAQTPPPSYGGGREGAGSSRGAANFRSINS